MKKRIAQYIDERVEALIPCITKQVEERLREKPEKVEAKKSSDTVHDVKCTGCATPSIVGIRYKCQECVDFNLCEACEKDIEHHHNLIKMKNKEQPK